MRATSRRTTRTLQRPIDRGTKTNGRRRAKLASPGRKALPPGDAVASVSDFGQLGLAAGTSVDVPMANRQAAKTKLRILDISLSPRSKLSAAPTAATLEETLPYLGICAQGSLPYAHSRGVRFGPQGEQFRP